MDNPTNHPDYPAALKALDDMYANTEVAREDAIDALEHLAEQIEIKLDALQSEIDDMEDDD